MCDGIEEVISSRDDEENSTSSQQTTTWFPHFDTLDLQYLFFLKRIGGEENTWRSMRGEISSNTIHHQYFQSGQVMGAYWTLCQYSRKISVGSCRALSSLVPWYAVGQMKRLQELEIKDCDRMVEVFESESMNNNVEETLKKITTYVVVPQFSNLKIVSIFECDRLPHVFTFSTLKTLNNLKELKIKRCKTIQVIVKEENGTSSSSEVEVFCGLETLELDRLPSLKGIFFGKNHEFKWPSLVNVMINDCPQWVGELETSKIKYVSTSFGKFKLESCDFNFQTTFPTSSSSDPTDISQGMPFSFGNLTEINIEDTYVERSTIIPSNALQQLQKLEQINVHIQRGLKEVFEVVALEAGTNNKSQITTVVKIPNLTQLKLCFQSKLKYLWKSNQRMVLEFPNLTTVFIKYCENLEHVFTCSMVGSLVHLQDLQISDCWHMEAIVKEEEEECGAKANEIMLPRLNSLKLDNLTELKGFCLGKHAFLLPALETLQIKRCPELTVFTKGQVATPQLKVIDSSFGKCDVRTDFNSFIDSKQEERNTF